VRHTHDILQARVTVKNSKYSEAYGLDKVFALGTVGMTGQIHADFLRLIWVLTDKQMWSYYESMGKEDNIRNDAFRLARAKAFNSNKTSIGRAIGFSCPTICHLSVHSLALPRQGSGDDSRGGGTGTVAPGGGPRGGRCCTTGESNLSEGEGVPVPAPSLAVSAGRGFDDAV